MDIVVTTREMIDRDYRYIPKEIAVMTIDGTFTAHWITAPPHPYAELPYSARVQNNALTQLRHKIEWHEGVVSCDQVYENLRKISEYSRKIFVHRVETFAILVEILERKKIIRLCEEEIMEDLSQLPTTHRECLWHGMSHGMTTDGCAFNEVLSVKKWIQILYPTVENNKKQLY